MSNEEKIIEALMTELEFTGEGRGERKGITFWVKPDVHAVYLKVQEDSKKNFGKSFERLLTKVLRKKAS